uniref:Uncharacterized protein n=1 Tax=Triticum urartu TaxID=4572 RepID=A0A8R7JY80_TRIUA
ICISFPIPNYLASVLARTPAWRAHPAPPKASCTADTLAIELAGAAPRGRPGHARQRRRRRGVAGHAAIHLVEKNSLDMTIAGKSWVFGTQRSSKYCKLKFYLWCSVFSFSINTLRMIFDAYLNN